MIGRGRGLGAVGVLALALIGQISVAQDVTFPVGRSVTILTIDEDRFFIESRFGRAALEQERAATAALEAENARIERALIAEEQLLTEQRKTLPADEFAALAQAFDDKVERIRDEQDAKARDLTQLREAERQDFLRVAVPVLGELMEEKGAVAIVDKSAIILSLTEIDITEEAITRVDRAASREELPSGSP